MQSRKMASHFLKCEAIWWYRIVLGVFKYGTVKILSQIILQVCDISEAYIKENHKKIVIDFS